MFESKTIENQLAQETEQYLNEQIKIDKEIRIQKLLHNLQQGPLESKSHIVSGVVYTIIGVGIILMLALIFSENNPHIKNWPIFDSLGFFLLIGYSLLSYKTISFMEGINAMNQHTLYLKELFLELIDNPHEIRFEYEGSNIFKKFKQQKIKVVIEENLYIGNCHVIKEKSRHITAYLDANCNQTSICQAMVALVQKAEQTFLKK